ncbi:MAG: DNA polymerase IV [Chloroflexota bacterium]
MKPRKILHFDLDAFFCAVEEQRDPSLKGKMFAVGGKPEHRGVVASCSYPARRYGVRSAMPMARALRLCPRLIIVPSRHDAYQAVSKQVMAQLHDLTPFVEQLSIDEAFLDVSELPESGGEIARQLQARIRDKLGLPCSLGVASNKLIAKIANDFGKSETPGHDPPNAIKVVPPGQEAQFLAPLPTQSLWGIGPKTAERLAALGLTTIGDVAQWPADDLARRFGKLGADLNQRARGIDERPVEVDRETKSISQEVTFPVDVSDGDVLRNALRKQAERVGRRLRKSNLSGSTVRLKIRWADFTTRTRQTTLPRPTNQDNEIYEQAVNLFEKIWQLGRPVRLIGLGVSGFGQPRQLGLWDEASAEGQQLQQTLDDLRERFGDDAIKWGRDLPDK